MNAHLSTFRLLDIQLTTFLFNALAAFYTILATKFTQLEITWFWRTWVGIFIAYAYFLFVPKRLCHVKPKRCLKAFQNAKYVSTFENVCLSLSSRTWPFKYDYYSSYLLVQIASYVFRQSQVKTNKHM